MGAIIFNVVMVLLMLVLLRIFDRKLADLDSSEDAAQYRESDRGKIAA